MRNQWLNAPQDTTADPKPGGHGSDRTAHPMIPWAVGELHGWVKSLVGEATVRACGVVVAMVQGHSWVPIPSKGLADERGNRSGSPGRPPPPAAHRCGWTHGLSNGPGRGGGPVVLRGRESRPLGEGAQQDRSTAERGRRHTGEYRCRVAHRLHPGVGTGTSDANQAAPMGGG